MKKLLFIVLILAVVALILGGLRFIRRSAPRGQNPLQSASAYTAGDYREHLTIDGRTRTYLLHIPVGYTPSNQYPLVALFHGGGGSGAKIAGQTNFPEKADKEGFILLAPDGIAHNWNDGRDTTDAYKQGVDDIAFIRALMKNLTNTLPIDQNRIYATGVSNGGIFSERLGCEMADVFAVIGPVVGPIATLLAPKCNPSAPISVVGIQGVADPGIPIGGGEQGGFGGFGDGGFVESADATMRLWAGKNECPTTPIISDLPPAVHDGTRVKKYTYTPCRNATEINYYIVEGMGHGWPPRPPDAPRLAGPTSHNINATEVIWEFFKTHRKQ